MKSYVDSKWSSLHLTTMMQSKYSINSYLLLASMLRVSNNKLLINKFFRMKQFLFVAIAAIICISGTTLFGQISDGVQVESQPIEMSSLKGDYSEYFIHEIVEGRYELIKNVQGGKEIIFRDDKIEILTKANPATGLKEVSTYLLFDGVDAVKAKGKNLIKSTTEKVRDLYGLDAVDYLKSESIDIHKYQSVVYSDIYRGTDLEITTDRFGDMVFTLVSSKGGVSDKTLDLIIWDSNAQHITNGIMTNGVHLTSQSNDLNVKDGKVVFDNKARNNKNQSFTLSVKSSSH